MVRSSTKGVISKKDQIIMDREAPDVSGLYMRSLVKKMTPSKLKNQVAADGFCQGGGFQGSSEVVNTQTEQTFPVPQQQQQQHKIKARRRLHTSRPYQERLLNMAEARREIVTALKFHRASMKQKQQQQQQQLSSLQILSNASPPDLEAKVEMNSSSKRPMIYPSDGGLIFDTSVDKFPQSPSITYDLSNHMFYSNATVPSVSTCENSSSSFSFSLPSQTLGLNLNFQDFSNLSTSHFQTNSSLFTSPSSSYSSPALSSTTTEEIHSAAEDSHIASVPASQPDNMGGAGGVMLTYPPTMDSEVMKEIKSMGDCYDMVWNDTMNSLTSAWWLNFSKAAETSPEELKQAEDEHLLTQLTELPSWLNPTDYYLQQQLNITSLDSSSLPDPTLTCMDIGEIEGIDGADWFT